MDDLANRTYARATRDRKEDLQLRGQRATVKKTYNLPPALVSRAKRILKSRTETEGIVRSLEEVAFRDEVERAVRSTGGKLPDFHPLK